MFNQNAHLILQETCNLSEKIGLPKKIGYFSGLPKIPYAKVENILMFSHKFERYAKETSKSHHHRFVLVICLRSKAHVVVDGMFFRLSAGEAILVHPFQFHHYTNIEGDDRQWQFITFACCDPESLSILKNSAVVLNEESLLTLKKILRLYLIKEKNPEDMAAIELGLDLFLQEMISICRKVSHEKKHKRLSKDSSNNFIETIARYIYDNMQHPIHIKDIAEKVHTSPGHLRNKFKDIMGTSIGKYIQKTRIQRSCTMLNSTDSDISEVAVKCGYDSLYSFSRTFKKAMGMSPSLYRKNIRQKT